MDKNKYEDEEYDMEDWEAEYYCFEDGDFQRLVQIRTNDLKKYPNNFEYKYRLCEAYILNEEYSRALKGLTKLYKEVSDNMLINHSILDCLTKLEKNESEFDWIIKPKILEINKETLDLCFEFLKGKRKPRQIYEIYEYMRYPSYLRFNEIDLYNALVTDDRFIVMGDEDCPWSAEVKRKPIRR